MQNAEMKSYKLTGFLCSRACCSLYKCKENNSSSQEEFCLKRYDLSDHSTYYKALNELEISLFLRHKHENILSLEEYSMNNSSLMLIYKFFPLGDFGNFIGKNILSLQVKKEIMFGILQGLKFLHENQIVHGDVKFENVLIFFDEEKRKYIPKLCDFNNSVMNDKSDFHSYSQKVNCNFLTENYSAPEVFCNIMKFSSDMWSFGVMLFFIIYGEMPFKSNCLENKNFQKKFKKEYKAANNLIKKLLNKYEEKRISVDDALNHIFFKELNPDFKKRLQTFVVKRQRIRLRLAYKKEDFLRFVEKTKKRKLITEKSFIALKKAGNCSATLHQPSPVSNANSLASMIRSPIKYDTKLDLKSPGSFSREINPHFQISHYNLTPTRQSEENLIILRNNIKLLLSIVFTDSVLQEYSIKSVEILKNKSENFILNSNKDRTKFKLSLEDDLDSFSNNSINLNILFKNKKTGKNSKFTFNSVKINVNKPLLRKLVKSNTYPQIGDSLWKVVLGYELSINKLI